MQNIEFICVNDGSTDNSLDIIKKYIDKDSRFRLIDKDNSGYGKTMNVGVSSAKGRYIGIVESDDYVEPDMFETLYYYADSLQLDLIKSHYYRFTTNEDGTYRQTLMKYTTNVNKVVDPSDYPALLINTTANWTGLYLKSFLDDNNIKHSETPGASYQDIGFHLITLSLSKRAYFLDRAFYHYRFDNPNSSINNREKIYCASKEYDSVFQFYDENPEIGDIFKGTVWARYHNTCINTFDRIDDRYKKEFLDYYCDVFGKALANGELKRESFSPNRWKEMNSILENPERFYFERKRILSRKKVINKYKNKKIPLPYYFIWSLQSDGIVETMDKVSSVIKKKMGIKHWDLADDPLTHIGISFRKILNKLHLNFLIRDYKKNQSLKNTHVGERCFIVCTGPSLKMEDLDKISNEYTISMNTIFLAYDKTEWRPSCYACIDAYATKRLAKEYHIDYNTISKGPVILNKKIKTNTEENVYRVPVSFLNHTDHNLKDNKMFIETNLSLYTYDCFSVTNFAILIAIFMGFSEINIIGCDCNYDGKIHFVQSKLDPKHEEKDRWSNAVYLSILGYEAVKKYADEKNVKIYNATRGGQLEVFERRDFDSIDFKQ